MLPTSMSSRVRAFWAGLPLRFCSLRRFILEVSLGWPSDLKLSDERLEFESADYPHHYSGEGTYVDVKVEVFSCEVIGGKLIDHGVEDFFLVDDAGLFFVLE